MSEPNKSKPGDPIFVPVGVNSSRCSWWTMLERSGAG